MEILKTCPVCNEPELRIFLKTKDHFLSGEEFTISECISCGFRFTNPRPGEDKIHSYYDSPDYIAHDSSSFSLVQLLYTTARKFTLRNKYNMITKHAEGRTLLDIGCGTGEFLNYCREKGFSVTGVEPGEKARNFAIDRYSLSVTGPQDLDRFPGSSFKVITMWHVLEHVHTLAKRMAQIHRLLDRDGLLVVALPNCNSWDAGKYGPFWAAYDLPRHLSHFTPDTMNHLAGTTGFLIQKIIPLKLDAFYISLLSEKYKTGRQNFFKAFLNGLRSNLHAGKSAEKYSSLVYLCRKRPG